MNLPPSVRTQLSWLLEQEIADMDALASLLREESQLLLAREPERLEQLLEAKSIRVSELASLDRRREELFHKLGVEGDSSEVAQALDTLFPSSGLGELWSRLVSLAEGCRQLNRINSATVEIGQLHLSQALQILRGGRAGDTLYGADGERTGDRTTTRLLGQA